MEMISYILYGNLSYLAVEDDMSSLIAAVFHHASTFNNCTNSFKLDCVSRCFISALERSKSSNIDSIHISFSRAKVVATHGANREIGAARSSNQTAWA